MAFVYWKYLSNATRLGGATALISHTARRQELGTKQQLWAVKMNTTPVTPGEPAYLERHVERLCSCNAYGPSLWKGDKDYTEGGEEGRQGVPLLKKERGKKKKSPSAPNLLRILPVLPLQTSIKPRGASHRSSLTLILLPQHVKRLHRQIQGQEAIGAKDRKKKSQPLHDQKKISASE